MLVGLLLFVAHYSLLHAWSGAIANLIEAVVVYVAYQKETKAWAKYKFWLPVFILIFVITGLLSSKTVIDFFPVLGQMFGTVAVWQKNPKAIRFIMLAPRPLWFIYNFIVGSYAGMLAEIFILLSVVTGIVRFDILGKPAKQVK